MDAFSASPHINLAHPVHELGQGHSHPPCPPHAPQPLEASLGSNTESSLYFSHRPSRTTQLLDSGTGQGFEVEMGEAG